MAVRLFRGPYCNYTLADFENMICWLSSEEWRTLIADLAEARQIYLAEADRLKVFPLVQHLQRELRPVLWVYFPEFGQYLNSRHMDTLSRRLRGTDMRDKVRKLLDQCTKRNSERNDKLWSQQIQVLAKFYMESHIRVYQNECLLDISFLSKTLRTTHHTWIWQIPRFQKEGSLHVFVAEESPSSTSFFSRAPPKMFVLDAAVPEILPCLQQKFPCDLARLILDFIL